MEFTLHKLSNLSPEERTVISGVNNKIVSVKKLMDDLNNNRKDIEKMEGSLQLLYESTFEINKEQIRYLFYSYK